MSNRGKEPYDYKKIDPFKVEAQAQALSTAGNIVPYGYQVLPESYGESVAVIDMGDRYLAAVEEGIGTKNVVADLVDGALDFPHMPNIVRCGLATQVNDLSTSGARPLIALDFIAAGEDSWFENKKRAQAYAAAKAAVCTEIGVAWVGGESQVLKGIVMPTRAVMAGALIGDIMPKSRYISGENMKAGDVIVLVESNGAHANGYTGFRKMANLLEDVYDTKLSDGTTLGEALLAPSHLYSNLVQSLLDNEVEVHRLENITGHGWRKLMRAKQPYRYVIENLPPESPLFSFIQQEMGYDDSKMYGSYTMGAGFALYLPKDQAEKTIQLAAQQELEAWIAGRVEDGPKQVVIRPKGVVFEDDDLAIRG